ncbi:MAG: TonB-dependent receptor, partial [Planctomycetota bacterium]
MRKYALTLLALALALSALLGGNAAPAYAQVGKVTGVVTDATTGEVLAGVQVYIEGTGRGALSADNGRYFILNVPPGTYVLVAEIIGYATVRTVDVVVGIDVTRTVDFEMTPQAIAVEELVVEAERVPLVETTATGARDAITSMEVMALPVADVGGALSLRSGFLQVPQNTDVISLQEERRGLSPIRIRGGRAGETLTLIDGVPINNFVFGGPGFDITPYAVSTINYERGGFEPQYGNALSGIINIATREAGTELQGTLELQSSRVGGALGSDHDELLDSDLWQGFLGGPVPGTGEKLRFVLAGRMSSRADRVLEFDQEVYNPLQTTPEYGFNQPHTLDIQPGWRAMGYDQKRDIFGKLTYYFRPTAKLSVLAVDYQRQRQAADFQWQLNAFDAVSKCVSVYGAGAVDVCNSVYGFGRTANYRNLAMHTYRLDRSLFAAYWDQTVGRGRYRITAGR